MAGTETIRTGEPAVFLKVVAVAPAVVTRNGQVRAAGSPCSRATLGPLEEWLDAQAGPGVIDGIAARAVLDGRFVKGERERLLTAAFMIRLLVLQSLMPGSQPGDVIAALAGDLALVPWSRPWRQASERSCLDWRKALGPVPLEELQSAVLAAARGEHTGRPGQCLVNGPVPAAGRALGGRVFAAGAGHAGEPGRVRVRRHRGRLGRLATRCGCSR